MQNFLRQLNHLYFRCRVDGEFRGQMAGRVSFWVTAAYSLLKAGAGLWLRSAYLGAMALYQLTLGVVRLYLLSKTRRRGKRRMPRREQRVVGLGLIGLTLELVPICYHATVLKEAPRYPGYLIYGAAAFTFYSLTNAIINLCRASRTRREPHAAGRILSFSSALASLFFLETALLAEFGDDGRFSVVMIALTGTAMLLTILAMGLFLIAGGRRKGTK